MYRAALADDRLRRVNAPTLLIVGGADTDVLALDRRALQLLPAEKQLSIVPGATHLLRSRGARPRTVINEDVVRTAGVSKSELAKIVEAELAKIECRRRLWLSDRPHVSIAGHSAIVVDDGIATGASARVALQAVRAEGAARVILAMPVAPAETAEMLRAECDDIVCLATPEDFTAVGIYYEDFHQVDDKEVQELLQRAPI